MRYAIQKVMIVFFITGIYVVLHVKENGYS